MVVPDVLDPDSALGCQTRYLREGLYGLLYWLMFLLVLEPDNVFRAVRGGYALGFDHEVLRIGVAAVLGAGATPLLMGFIRRCPVVGPGRWRHRLAHAVAIPGLALGLILVSCFLAAWGFERRWLPSPGEIREQIVCNGLLVAYAVFALNALAHAFYAFEDKQAVRSAVVPSGRLTRIPVSHRGRRSYVEIADVDWIETQGNYLALHSKSTAHLIRATSLKFEAQLDPERFVRIHRRLIVAVDRIQELRPLGNGDAVLRLLDGRELRVSRRHRKTIAQRWGAASRTSPPISPSASTPVASCQDVRASRAPRT